MALKNRTEAKAVVTAWAAILNLEATHKPDLRDEILNNCIFRKDVSTSTTASGATKTLEFLDVDYIEVNQSNADVVYTLNNIQQGEIKYLQINMVAGLTISFSNASNQAYDQDYLNGLSEILYLLINKDGNILAIPLTLDIRVATTAEAKALTDDVKLITPKKIGDVTVDTIWSEFEIGDWDMDATIAISVNIGAIGNDDIRTVSVIIRRDDDSAVVGKTYSLDAGGFHAVTAGSTIVLTRDTAGIFDDTGFDKTPFNRGWVMIQHKL